MQQSTMPRPMTALRCSTRRLRPIRIASIHFTVPRVGQVLGNLSLDQRQLRTRCAVLWAENALTSLGSSHCHPSASPCPYKSTGGIRLSRPSRPFRSFCTGFLCDLPATWFAASFDPTLRINTPRILERITQYYDLERGRHEEEYATLTC